VYILQSCTELYYFGWAGQWALHTPILLCSRLSISRWNVLRSIQAAGRCIITACIHELDRAACGYIYIITTACIHELDERAVMRRACLHLICDRARLPPSPPSLSLFAHRYTCTFNTLLVASPESTIAPLQTLDIAEPAIHVRRSPPWQQTYSRCHSKFTCMFT